MNAALLDFSFDTKPRCAWHTFGFAKSLNASKAFYAQRHQRSEFSAARDSDTFDFPSPLHQLGVLLLGFEQSHSPHERGRRPIIYIMQQTQSGPLLAVHFPRLPSDGEVD